MNWDAHYVRAPYAGLYALFHLVILSNPLISNNLVVGGSWYHFLPRAVFARHGLYGTQGYADNNAGEVNDPFPLSNNMS
jgi:hypothetical protein